MNNDQSRRDFLKFTAMTGISMGIPISGKASINRLYPLRGESRLPNSATAWKEKIAQERIPYEGLVSSLYQESDLDCEIKGALPSDLSGELIRTGSGIFDRADMRRRMEIDVDGMIRRFQFKNGKVQFTNRHIRTKKFVAEEKAGHYTYPSFGMLVPSSTSVISNSFAWVENQAGVCAFVFGNRLFATDEIQPLTELNIQNLETIGEATMPGAHGKKYMAHYRITDFGKKYLHLASFVSPTRSLQVLTYDEDFKLIEKTNVIKVPRSFHDWHATKDYFIFLLPPLFVNGWEIAKAMVGESTLADAVVYDGSKPTQVLIVPRDGREAITLTLDEKVDSWHSVNAFQKDSSDITLDFIASSARSSIASYNSNMTKIMRGEVKQDGSLRSSKVYRINMNYEQRKIEVDRSRFQAVGIEMPTIDSKFCGKNYEDAFFIAGQDILDHQIIRMNIESGLVDKFDFGPDRFVTEPIFAPSTESDSKGYVLSEVYCYQAKKSYLAVFAAENISQGPVAEVWLPHHLPIGFHGFWREG